MKQMLTSCRKQRVATLLFDLHTRNNMGGTRTGKRNKYFQPGRESNWRQVDVKCRCWQRESQLSHFTTFGLRHSVLFSACTLRQGADLKKVVLIPHWLICRALPHSAHACSYFLHDGPGLWNGQKDEKFDNQMAERRGCWQSNGIQPMPFIIGRMRDCTSVSLPFQDSASCLFPHFSKHAPRHQAGWESRESTYRCSVSPSEHVDHVTEGGALAQVVYDVDLWAIEGWTVRIDPGRWNRGILSDAKAVLAMQQ
jgi:hypothetical protein